MNNQNGKRPWGSEPTSAQFLTVSDLHSNFGDLPEGVKPQTALSCSCPVRTKSYDRPS